MKSADHTFDAAALTRQFYERDLQRYRSQIDRMFGWLLLIQWAGAVALTLWMTPLTWSGDQSSIHPHVWTALFLVGGVTFLPAVLTWLDPGRSVTRQTVAIGQMLTSGLLIHLTGGRIETHFHIFVSLAFLALYRDWTVIVTATAIVILDHGVRGLLWPESIYGEKFSAYVANLHTLEHGFWVVFESAVLVYSGIKKRREMLVNAGREAEMTINYITIEHQVESRTYDLEVSRDKIEAQAEMLLEQAVELTKARDQAEEASRVKSEFLANMSHEIRTPLTAIMGFADYLEEHNQLEKHAVQRREALNTIRNASKHLLTVINDILDLSKIEANHLELEQAHISLPGVLQEVESLLRPRALSKGVTLTTKVLHAIPVNIIADPTRLRQILMNLVGNAVKFTEHGQITIEVDLHRMPYGRGTHKTPHEVSPASTTFVEWLQIDIRDTGPGLNDDLVSRLFHAFTQADSTTSRRFGGSGLGLKIARKLARLMGGEVELHSTQVGRGSCFRLTLPLTVEPNSPYLDDEFIVSNPESSESSKSATETRLDASILLVEDGYDNQRLVSLILRKAGATVEVADNGVEALEWMDLRQSVGQPFDLVLTDMQMPVMDGYVLAQELRSRGETMPIIALTAHAMAEDRRKCLEAGCDDYCTKPINRCQLLRTIQMWLNKKRVETCL